MFRCVDKKKLMANKYLMLRKCCYVRGRDLGPANLFMS